MLPSSRSLYDTLHAIELTADECRFQAYRLRELVTARTPAEADHHAQLQEEYILAAQVLRRLRRYVRKRIHRAEQLGEVPHKRFDQAGAIDAGGIAMAFPDDGDSPI